jgi:hypothetical protein
MTIGWRALAILGVLAGGLPGDPARAADIELAGGPPTRNFTLSIEGSADASVVAACLVSTGQDIDIVTLKGPVPQVRDFAAIGLSCQIQKIGQAGRLDIQIKRDGRIVSRSQSSGTSSVVSVSVQ